MFYIIKLLVSDMYMYFNYYIKRSTITEMNYLKNVDNDYVSV